MASYHCPRKLAQIGSIFRVVTGEPAKASSELNFASSPLVQSALKKTTVGISPTVAASDVSSLDESDSPQRSQ